MQRPSDYTLRQGMGDGASAQRARLGEFSPDVQFSTMQIPAEWYNGLVLLGFIILALGLARVFLFNSTGGLKRERGAR